MKRSLFLVLFAMALAFSAFAVTNVDNMAAQCAAVMDSGVCRVALDPKDYPNATVLIAGVGRVSTASYLRIRNAGQGKDADGQWTMCRLVHDACTSESSDDCIAARALFSQLAPSIRPPGSNSAGTIQK